MAGKAQVTINFKNYIPIEFSSNEGIEEALIAFHGDECTVLVFDAEIQGNDGVYFELYSERDKNLIWQQNLLKEYLKENYPEEITYFNTNVWTTNDDEDIYFEEGNGQEFKEL